MATTIKPITDPSPIYHTVGKSTVLGTDWTIENKLEVIRHRHTRKIAGYQVTFRICNGTAGGSKIFKSRAEAVAALIAD